MFIAFWFQNFCLWPLFSSLRSKFIAKLMKFIIRTLYKAFLLLLWPNYINSGNNIHQN